MNYVSESALDGSRRGPMNLAELERWARDFLSAACVCNTFDAHGCPSCWRGAIDRAPAACSTCRNLIAAEILNGRFETALALLRGLA